MLELTVSLDEWETFFNLSLNYALDLVFADIKSAVRC